YALFGIGKPIDLYVDQPPDRVGAVGGDVLHRNGQPPLAIDDLELPTTLEIVQEADQEQRIASGRITDLARESARPRVRRISEREKLLDGRLGETVEL